MILLYDNVTEGQITVDATKRTSDGYLAASARVARTGIQIYTGRECGRPDLEFVRVYRPESEVFKADAIKTFAHRPITDDHPHQSVTADNWRALSKGHTGEEVVRDGKFIRVPMLLMDGPTIKKWEEGKRELSMGYACDLAWEDGITPDGEEYDAIQRNIRANHLALVKKARGGENLRIGDTDMKTCPECGHKMPVNAKECPECHHEMVNDADWDPTKHPRSPDGKFTAAGEITIQHMEGGVKHKLPLNKRVLSLTAAKEHVRERYPHHNVIKFKLKKIIDGDDSAADGSTADDLDTGADNTGEPTMRIMVDGISLEITDKDAQIIQRALDKSAADIKAANDEIAKMKEEEEKKKKKYETDAATLTTQVATLTTENTQLKQQVKDAEVTPAKLEALATERTAVIDKATAILGKDKVVKTDSSAAIRRACVNHVVGDAAKDWSDDLVNASFATIKTTQVSDGTRKLANSFDHQQQPGNTTVLDTAYDKYEENLRKASQAAAA